MDQEVEALRRLLRATKERPGGDPARRREVAERAGCNPDNLYQIARGIALPSNRPRLLGRDVRERIDRAFPGWMDGASVPTPSSPPQAQQTSFDEALDEALEVVGIAIAAAPVSAREVIAINLAGWARAGGADDWQRTLLAALAPTMVASSKRGA